MEFLKLLHIFSNTSCTSELTMLRLLAIQFTKQQVLDKALRFFLQALKNIVFALFLSLLALAGGSVGTVVGAFKGHGVAIGAIAGAAVALQLMNCDASGQRYSLSKEAIIERLKNGKELMNWASDFSEFMYREISEFIDITRETGYVEGMSMESVHMLPVCEYDHTNMNNSISCAICLEEFEEREFGRILPNCDHFFHVGCIDQWLQLHGSCPNCRQFCT